jgi:hypothetical protein
VADSGGDVDVLEGGESRSSLVPSGRWAVGVAAGLIGLLIGYSIGHHHAPTRTVPPAASTTAAPHLAPSVVSTIGPPFAQTGATCSVQHGRRLQLGIQVENQSPASVHVTGLRTREPLPGLRPLATGLGTCGQIKGTPVSVDPTVVPAGTATWLTVTVRVLVKCPAADPVQFRVDYRRGHHNSVERLAGFDDLGYVPYSGCAS